MNKSIFRVIGIPTLILTIASLEALAECPKGYVEVKYENSVICMLAKNVVRAFDPQNNKAVIDHLKNQLEYQTNLCNNYADMAMDQVKVRQGRKCDFGDDQEWSNDREKYVEDCTDESYTKGQALGIIEYRNQLLNHICYSEDGDLEAGWCYTIDVHPARDRVTNGGLPYLSGTIDFYGIIKNAGEKEWNSNEPGIISVRAFYGSVLTTRNESWWGSSIRNKTWRKVGEKWTIGPISYPLTTRPGFARYSPGLLSIYHTEDNNPSNDRTPENWQMKSAKEFLERSDDDKITGMSEYIEKDGSMIKYKCKYQLAQ